MKAPPLLDTPLLRDPQYATVEHEQLSIVLPLRGQPLAFDPASLTLLECFESIVTPREVAADLVDAVGLDVTAAEQMIERFALTLVRSGHLYKSDHGPRRFGSNYPPAASP